VIGSVRKGAQTHPRYLLNVDRSPDLVPNCPPSSFSCSFQMITDTTIMGKIMSVRLYKYMRLYCIYIFLKKTTIMDKLLLGTEITTAMLPQSNNSWVATS
jgi:hypothetical protein